MRRIAGIAGLVLLLAGCGGETSVVAGGPVPSPGPSATARPLPTTGGAKLVTPRSGMDNVHPISWTYAQARGARTVRIYYYAGIEPCTVLDHVVVAYSASNIAITLYTGSDPTAQGRACIEIARSTAVDVDLTEAPGERTFIDGRTGRPSGPTPPPGSQP